MAVNRYDGSRAWYAISTYSGYEDKVADSIKQRIGSADLANKIFDALVPKEKQIEIKNGKRRVADKKIFQGYVLVEMCLSDETWYIIRNTPGVTGFVGTGTQPTPVSKKEIEKIFFIGLVEEFRYYIPRTLLDLGVYLAYVLAYDTETEELQTAYEPYGAHGT